MAEKLRVAVVVGTRPEAVKLAPVIRALAGSHTLAPLTLCTSQHGQMVHQTFRSFGIHPCEDLRIMRPGQTLWDLSARLVQKLGAFFANHPVAAVLVQGDTTSALFGGLAAFYHRLPVGHVEAGLRTGDPGTPFPEEMNRKLLASVAAWHFAPTPLAAKRLRTEGVSARSIYVTGNTVVDALRWMAPRLCGKWVKQVAGNRMGKRMILVTCHRRESLGTPIARVARALATLARENPDLMVLFPVHPNPEVRDAVVPALRGLKNVVLTKPLDYDHFLACLRHAYFVISDSGGVQEEATALGKPVLVLREKTERPEGLQAGALKLVGTDPDKLLRASRRLLTDARFYRRMSRASAVFGDGHAAGRIVAVLERELC